MNINIKGARIEVTDAIRSYIFEKFEAIAKVLNRAEEAFIEVEVGKDSHHNKGDVFRAEVNIMADGNQYYVVIVKDDLYAALDELKDEVMEKIKSSKDKSRSRFRRGAARVKNFVKGLWSKKGDTQTYE